MGELYLRPNFISGKENLSSIINKAVKNADGDKGLETAKNFLISIRNKERDREKKYLDKMEVDFPSIFGDKKIDDWKKFLLVVNTKLKSTSKEMIEEIQAQRGLIADKIKEMNEIKDKKSKKYKNLFNEVQKILMDIEEKIHYYRENSKEYFSEAIKAETGFKVDNISSIKIVGSEIKLSGSGQVKSYNEENAKDFLMDIIKSMYDLQGINIAIEDYIELDKKFAENFNRIFFKKDDQGKIKENRELYDVYMELFSASKGGAPDFDINKLEKKIGDLSKKISDETMGEIRRILLKKGYFALKIEEYIKNFLEQCQAYKTEYGEEETKALKVNMSFSTAGFAEINGARLISGKEIKIKGGAKVERAAMFAGKPNRKTDTFLSIGNGAKDITTRIFENLREMKSNETFDIKKESDAILAAFDEELKVLKDMNVDKSALANYLGIDISTKLFDRGGHYDRKGIHMGSLGSGGKIPVVVDNLLTVLNSANTLDNTNENVRDAIVLTLLNSIKNYFEENSSDGILKAYLTSAATICMFSSGNILAQQLSQNMENNISNINILHLFDIGGEIIPLSYVIDKIIIGLDEKWKEQEDQDINVNFEIKQDKAVPKLYKGYSKEYTPTDFAGIVEKASGNNMIKNYSNLKKPTWYYKQFENSITGNLKLSTLGTGMDSFLTSIENLFKEVL